MKNGTYVVSFAVDLEGYSDDEKQQALLSAINLMKERLENEECDIEEEFELDLAEEREETDEEYSEESEEEIKELDFEQEDVA
jgi:hypothetical protein